MIGEYKRTRTSSASGDEPGEGLSGYPAERTGRKTHEVLTETGGDPRILVANAPRAYREAIAGALRMLLPGVGVLVTEPESLECEVIRLRPDMVVCTKVTPLVEEAVPVWIDLYPNGESLAVISIDGRRSVVSELEFADLLSIAELSGRRGRHRTTG